MKGWALSELRWINMPGKSPCVSRKWATLCPMPVVAGDELWPVPWWSACFSGATIGQHGGIGVRNTTFRCCSHLDVSKKPTTCKGNWPLISCLAGGFVSSCCFDPCKRAMHRNQQNKSPYQTLSYLSNSFALRHCPGKDLREFASQIRGKSQLRSNLHQNRLVPDRLAYIFLIRLETPSTSTAQRVLSRVMSTEKSAWQFLGLKIFTYFNDIMIFNGFCGFLVKDLGNNTLGLNCWISVECQEGAILAKTWLTIALEASAHVRLASLRRARTSFPWCPWPGTSLVRLGTGAA